MANLSAVSVAENRVSYIVCDARRVSSGEYRGSTKIYTTFDAAYQLNFQRRIAASSPSAAYLAKNRGSSFMFCASTSLAIAVPATKIVGQGEVEPINAEYSNM
jgi:hypothetical protein